MAAHAIALEGYPSSRSGIEGAICFRGEADVLADGGVVSVKDNVLTVEGADSATPLLATATNYKSLSEE